MEKATTSATSLGSAAHAAKRAADLLYVLQNKDRLPFQALVDQLNVTLKVYDETDEVSYADLDDLKSVAKRLLAVFEVDDVNRAAQVINELLDEYARRPRLSAHGASPWHLHVDRDDDASWAEWFAASSAMAFAILLAEKQRNPGGLCASAGCGRPFIDLGKGGGRSYCSPRCATRERVAAYRKKV